MHEVFFFKILRHLKIVSVNTALQLSGFGCWLGPAKAAFSGTVLGFKAKLTRNPPKEVEKAVTATALIPESYFCSPELAKIDSVPKRTSSKYIFNRPIPHTATLLPFNPGRGAKANLKREKNVYESKRV